MEHKTYSLEQNALLPQQETSFSGVLLVYRHNKEYTLLKVPIEKVGDYPDPVIYSFYGYSAAIQDQALAEVVCLTLDALAERTGLVIAPEIMFLDGSVVGEPYALPIVSKSCRSSNQQSSMPSYGDPTQNPDDDAF